MKARAGEIGGGFDAKHFQIRELCNDPKVPVLCYPRNVDSIAFALGRDDMENFRGKETHLLVYGMQQREKTIVLCTHRHSLEGLRQALTPDLKITKTLALDLKPIGWLPRVYQDRVTKWMGETCLGLADIAVVEKRKE